MSAKPSGHSMEIATLELRKAALYFRAINHKLRLQILQLLHKNNALSVGDIYRKLKLEQSVTSQHLAILRKADLVKARKDGKLIYYSVNHEQLAKLHSIATQLANA